jgi:hypothetical protein
MDIEELKQLIIHNLDVVDFLDLIGLDLSDLVETFELEIDINFDTLVSAVQ